MKLKADGANSDAVLKPFYAKLVAPDGKNRRRRQFLPKGVWSPQIDLI
jgi:hypothetical protein